MGGGDVKMIGAVMLWIPLPLFLSTLMVMAIAGGLLSGAMLIDMKLRRREQPPEVPYGVAIAAAGLWAVHQHYRSEEHTSELQSLMRISYAVFCLKKKNNTKQQKIAQANNKDI